MEDSSPSLLDWANTERSRRPSCHIRSGIKLNNKEKEIDDSDADTRANALEVSSAQHTFSELLLDDPDLKKCPRIETSC